MDEPRGPIGAGRTAVVTGAASGIGLALSRRLADEGMGVVMADVEEPALAAAAAELESRGARVLPVVTDVSRAEQVEALRDRALEAFGAVHLLCNNAGVGGPLNPEWEITRGDWEWVLGVNLWGVINGVRSFLPVLLEQDAAHVVNTASVFGLFAGNFGPYSVSKHAVVALSESLHFHLRRRTAPAGVSVLCPGAVRTRFGNSDRNRPPDAGPRTEPDASAMATREMMNRLAPGGMDPAEVAGLVVGAVRSSRFYVLTHSTRNGAIRRRAEEILAGGPPAWPLE
jgi:NAD(P)-dependent dehydrogenase (short-subunit alcohol dehydrogenase family)